MSMYFLVTLLILSIISSLSARECWDAKDRNNKGSGYDGTKSRTRGGYTCQNWKSNKVHKSKIKKKYGIGNNNYCRNPERKYKNVWCYTTNPKKRWDWCDVPTCSKYTCDCNKVNGEDYKATKIKYDLKRSTVTAARPDLVLEKEVINGGSRDLSVPFSQEVKVSETMSFTRTAGASVTVGTSFEAGIPGVGTAGVSTELSASIEFSSGKESTVEKTKTVKFTCTAPPHKRAVCNAMMKKDKINVPYVMTWSHKKLKSCICKEKGVFKEMVANKIYKTLKEYDYPPKTVVAVATAAKGVTVTPLKKELKCIKGGTVCEPKCTVIMKPGKVDKESVKICKLKDGQLSKCKRANGRRNKFSRNIALGKVAVRIAGKYVCVHTQNGVKTVSDPVTVTVKPKANGLI